VNDVAKSQERPCNACDVGLESSHVEALGLATSKNCSALSLSLSALQAVSHWRS
jgi:hypothetical protein